MFADTVSVHPFASVNVSVYEVPWHKLNMLIVLWAFDHIYVYGKVPPFGLVIISPSQAL